MSVSANRDTGQRGRLCLFSCYDRDNGFDERKARDAELLWGCFPKGVAFFGRIFRESWMQDGYVSRDFVVAAPTLLEAKVWRSSLERVLGLFGMECDRGAVRMELVSGGGEEEALDGHEVSMWFLESFATTGSFAAVSDVARGGG
jgi:hypothetical protein